MALKTKRFTKHISTQLNHPVKALPPQNTAKLQPTFNKNSASKHVFQHENKQQTSQNNFAQAGRKINDGMVKINW